ncbi:hypothetical protein ACHWQZ_G010888 [Mnemiopsis leidyi]
MVHGQEWSSHQLLSISISIFIITEITAATTWNSALIYGQRKLLEIPVDSRSYEYFTPSYENARQSDVTRPQSKDTLLYGERE